MTSRRIKVVARATGRLAPKATARPMLVSSLVPRPAGNTDNTPPRAVAVRTTEAWARLIGLPMAVKRPCSRVASSSQARDARVIPSSMGPGRSKERSRAMP